MLPLPSGWHWLVLWVLLGAIFRSTIVHTLRRTLTVGFREPRQSPAEQAAWVDVTMKELLAEGQGKGQVHSNKSKKKKAGRSSAAPEAAMSAATERAEAVLRAPSAGGGLGGGLPELELRRLVLELRQEATELRQEAEHKAKQEAAAEAAGLVAAARVRAVAAQREAVQIAAASKARKEAVAAAAAAAAAVLAAAVAAKADALERETAGGGEGGSSEAASPSEASEVAVPDQYVCSITAEIMTDPAITVRLSTLDYPAACPACKMYATPSLRGIEAPLTLQSALTDGWLHVRAQCHRAVAQDSQHLARNGRRAGEQAAHPELPSPQPHPRLPRSPEAGA